LRATKFSHWGGDIAPDRDLPQKAVTEFIQTIERAGGWRGGVLETKKVGKIGQRVKIKHPSTGGGGGYGFKVRLRTGLGKFGGGTGG